MKQVARRSQQNVLVILVGYLLVLSLSSFEIASSFHHLPQQQQRRRHTSNSNTGVLSKNSLPFVTTTMTTTTDHRVNDAVVVAPSFLNLSSQPPPEKQGGGGGFQFPEIPDTVKKVGALAATVLAFVIIQKVGLELSDIFTPELSPEQVRDFEI